MRFSLGRVLIVGGVAVGVVGAIAVALGLHTALPPAVLKVAAYKMVGIAALGLIVAGAALRRLELHERGDASRQALDSGGERALTPGGVRLDPAVLDRARQREVARQELRREPRDRPGADG